MEPTRGGSQDGNWLSLLGLALLWSRVRGVPTPLHSLLTLMIRLLPSLAFGGAVSTYEGSHREFKVPMITLKRELLRPVVPSPTIFGLARNGGTQKAKSHGLKSLNFMHFRLGIKSLKLQISSDKVWP